MSIKSKIASACAAGVIAVAAVLAVPVAAQATGNPSALDQGDFSIQCKASYGQNGWIAQLKGSNAYSWKCVYNNSTNSSTWKNVDINAYCMNTWGVWAMTTNPSSPYSWKCQGY